MPFINSYIHTSGGGGGGSAALVAGITGAGSMTANITKVTRERNVASFQGTFSTGTTPALSKTLSFTAMATSTQYSKRLVVFSLGANFTGSGGTITSVVYGGNNCTKAIGSVGAGDKGAAEIWYVNLPTNPASNNLVITANKSLIRVAATREVLMGMTSMSVRDTGATKKDSDQSIDFSIDHPSNGITLIATVLWWNGSSAANALYPDGGATKSYQAYAATGDEFGASFAYYVSDSQDNGRVFTNLWNGPGSPNNEMVGASFK